MKGMAIEGDAVENVLWCDVRGVMVQTRRSCP